MSRILSTFTALSLLVAMAACGKSRDAARAELAQMNIAYTDKAFVESAREGNATAVALFIDAGINPDTKNIAGRSALEAVRAGGKIVGVSFFGGSVSLPIDRMRERSLRLVFPDVSTREHLQHTVRLVATGRVRLEPTIRHVISGIESVPRAFEITANKGKYQAINPAQVMMR